MQPPPQPTVPHVLSAGAALDTQFGRVLDSLNKIGASLDELKLAVAANSARLDEIQQRQEATIATATQARDAAFVNANRLAFVDDVLVKMRRALNREFKATGDSVVDQVFAERDFTRR